MQHARHTTSHTGLDVDEEETQDPNNVEPQSVPLTEAKNSVPTLLLFVGDNFGIFSEEDFRHLVCLRKYGNGITTMHGDAEEVVYFLEKTSSRLKPR